MTEKRMIIVDQELAEKIDANRGDMSRADFLNFIIDSHLKEEAVPSPASYVDREEFEQFTRGIKELLRNFLDFFISYGLELGEEPKDKTFQELSKKLQSFAHTEGKSKASK